MTSCSIATCRNNSRDTKHVSFYIFPNNKSLADIWWEACKRQDILTYSKYSKICSDHFEFNAFKRDLKNELLNTPKRKLLREDAVPTLLLPSMKIQIPKLSQNTIQLSKSSSKLNRRRKRIGRKKGKRKGIPKESRMVVKERGHKKICSIPIEQRFLTSNKEIQDETDDPAPVFDFLEEEEMDTTEERLTNQIHCQTLLRNMFLDESVMDVILVTQNKSIKAHRAVLRQASGYFQKVLSLDMTAECEVRFNDIEYEDLLKLVAFIYQGDVSVRVCQLSRFLRVAESLEVFSLLGRPSGEDETGADEAFEFIGFDPAVVVKEEDVDAEEIVHIFSEEDHVSSAPLYSHWSSLEGEPPPICAESHPLAPERIAPVWGRHKRKGKT